MSKFSDTESIRTEDFANKFNDIYVPKDDNNKSKSFFSTSRLLPKSHTEEKEEVDSVMTEDFESRFRSYLVKPVPDLPLHELWENSEMSARSQKLRERVSSMFNIPTESIRLPDGGGGGDTDDGGDYMNKKFQEIMARRRRERSAPANGVQARSKTLPRNSKLDERHELVNNTGTNEYSNEIRSRSRQIKRELELERQRKRQVSHSPPPARTIKITTPPITSETLNRKVNELDQLTDTLRRAKSEKTSIMQDVATLQQNLRRHQADMRLTEKLIRDNRAKAEDMQTEMSMAELRRDNTMRELSLLNSDLEKRRSQLRDMERKLQDRVTDIQGMAGDGVGLSKQEIETLIAERDELYELLKNTEESEVQRFELERQLTLAKDDLRSEQQKAKDRIQSLEEELEASITKITELLRDRDALREQVHCLDHHVRLLEEEKQYSLRETCNIRDRYQEEIQRKLVEHEQDKAMVHSEVERLEKQRNTVENQLREQVFELKEIIKVLRCDLDGEKNRSVELRAQVQQLEKDLDCAQKGRNEILEEMDRKIREKEKEKDFAITGLREEMSNDRNRILSDIRHDFELHLRSLEDKFSADMIQNSSTMMIKDEEISYLKERLCHMEQSIRNEREEHRVESREFVKEAIAKEKIVWLEEQKARWSREVTNLRDETTRAVQAAEEAARNQRERANHLEATLNSVQEQLDEERKKTRNATKDKISAIRHLKDVAKEEMKKEIERIRSQQNRTTSDEVQKLRDQIDFYAQELLRIKESETENKTKGNEQKCILEKIQKAVVQEINEECAKMAAILEVGPRKVDLTKYSAMDFSGPLSARTSPITAALANLEACGEEIRAMMEELKTQLAEETSRIESLEESHAQEFEEIKKELRNEQMKKIAQIRDHLIQEHIKELERLSKTPDPNLGILLKEKNLEIEELRRSMRMWKEETVEKLANKLRDEFKREFEKKLLRLQARGGGGGGGGVVARVTDGKTITNSRGRSLTRNNNKNTHQQGEAEGAKNRVVARQSLIHQLQERVKQLRDENQFLRKQNSRQSSPSPVGKLNGNSLVTSNPNLFYANDDELDAIPQKEHKPTPMERLEAKVQKAANSNNRRQNGTCSERSPSLGRLSGRQHVCSPCGLHMPV